MKKQTQAHQALLIIVLEPGLTRHEVGQRARAQFGSNPDSVNATISHLKRNGLVHLTGNRCYPRAGLTEAQVPDVRITYARTKATPFGLLDQRSKDQLAALSEHSAPIVSLVLSVQIGEVEYRWPIAQHLRLVAVAAQHEPTANTVASPSPAETKSKRPSNQDLFQDYAAAKRHYGKADITRDEYVLVTKRGRAFERRFKGWRNFMAHAELWLAKQKRGDGAPTESVVRH